MEEASHRRLSLRLVQNIVRDAAFTRRRTNYRRDAILTGFSAEYHRPVGMRWQTDAFTRALLTENRDRLDRLVKILLDVETIEGDDLKRVVDGLDLEPPAEPQLPAAPSDGSEAPKTEETPGPQPKLGPPGLAWGSQSNIRLDGDGPSTMT